MAEGSNDGAARGRWNALAENSRQRRPKGVEGTVRFRTSFHNVVYDVFRARAWKETDSDVDWDVCWADTGAPRQAAPPLYSRRTSSTVRLAPCTVHLTAYYLTSHRADPWRGHLPPATCHLPPATCHLPPATCHLPPPRFRPGWIRENFDNIRLNEHQRINHFRNHYELTRKDSMIKNLKRAQRALQREGLEEEAAKYDFSPTTYVPPTLPSPSPSPSPTSNPSPSPSPNPNQLRAARGLRALRGGVQEPRGRLLDHEADRWRYLVITPVLPSQRPLDHEAYRWR